MKEYWEENLHALGREELIRRLDKIASVFNSLPLPEDYEKDQLYFVTKEDFDALRIGLSKKPLETFMGLQCEQPKKLLLLFYYDPMEQIKKLEESVPNAKVQAYYQTPEDVCDQQIKWLDAQKGRNPVQGWFHPDDWALQALIKKGMIYLKEIMTDLGLDYNEA